VVVHIIAALPERLADVGGVVIGIYLVIAGIALASSPERVTDRWPPTVARSIGFVMVVAGPVIGTFLVLAEGGCDTCSPWGTTQERVIMAIWVLVASAVTVRIVWKAFRPRSPAPP
jgi:protein-S-isoprenylcysteine O-methyltransferase Ste14